MVRVYTIPKGGRAIDLDYVKDHLFDLLNESDVLNITDIQSAEQENGFRVTVSDGSVFLITCQAECEE